MNPIFIEYYPHVREECYKINLPWSRYAKHTLVLCPVSSGYGTAKRLAKKYLIKHFREMTAEKVTQ